MRELLCIFAAALLALSCDDGPIDDDPVYAEEGAVVVLSGTFSGTAAWPPDYSLALAGFTPGDPYAVISKVLPAADGTFSLTMSGVPTDVETVELCVLNRLRQRVMTFRSADMSGVRDTLRFDVGELGTGMADAIQHAVLDQSCVACHGANGFSAAGLNLTAGHSRAAMVGVPSVKMPGTNIVEPGNVEASLLHKLLNSDVSAGWRQNHADMLNRERAAALLTLIDKWIEGGAGE